jgi:hypothetical protein
MAPMFQPVADKVAKHNFKNQKLSGFTHVMVVSDGDIFDEADTAKKIKEFYKHNDMVTIDVAVLKGKRGSAMEKMADSVKGKKPYQDVTVTHETDANKIPYAMAGALYAKIKKCRSFTAVPTASKKAKMKRSAKKLKDNKK